MATSQRIPTLCGQSESWEVDTQAKAERQLRHPDQRAQRRSGDASGEAFTPPCELGLA